MKMFEWITEGISNAFVRGFERGQQRVEKLAEARLQEIREGNPPMTIEELSTRRLDSPQTTNGRRTKKKVAAK